jgi:hypothetical protein
VSSNVPVAEATMRGGRAPGACAGSVGAAGRGSEGGLLALSVGVGLGVLTELMEEEVDDVVGPKGKHNSDRTAVRHGHEDGEVTLGGRRVEVQRPAGPRGRNTRLACPDRERRLASAPQAATT